MRRRLSLGGITLALSLLASTAYAHPLLDQARAAFDATQHARALEILEQAEDGRDLTRDDLAQLLLLRAQAHRALRQMDLAEVDMFRLAGLDPTRELGREVPPQLRRLFEQAQERVPGPIRIDVHAERNGEVVTIRAEVTDDVAALAQGFRLYGRPAGGTIQQTSDPRLDVHVPRSQIAEFWAEVLGPGGAVIAVHASEMAPDRLEGNGAVADGNPDGVGGDGDPDVAGGTGGDTGTGGGDEGVPAWPFIVGGAVIAVAIAVVLIVVFTVPSDDTQFGAPSVAGLVDSGPALLRF
ncbi:MAG: hypothetical protein AB7S26_32950 [Sandaracinaceae bacterium]